MKEWLSRINGWYDKHPRLFVLIVPLGFGLYVFVREMSSIYFAVPPLPAGKMQLVGLSKDAERFVVTQDRVEKDGKLRADILVTFEKPFKAENVWIRFETTREWIDCAKSVIEMEGAGFYNDHGEQVLTRYFERKPEAVGPIDMEADYLCHPRKIDVPPVTGYQAAMQQGRALRVQLLK